MSRCQDIFGGFRLPPLYLISSDKMYIDGKTLPTASSDNNIVMVYDAFGCMDKVLETNKGKSVYFISQTSEELAIEPRSIFNYALPVFLEYFVTDDVEHEEVLGCAFEGDLRPSKNVEIMTKNLLQAKYLPNLAYKRLETMLAVAQNFYGGNYGTDDVFMLQVMPIMLTLSMREQLIELIHQKYESASDATNALRLIGEPNEYNVD